MILIPCSYLLKASAVHPIFDKAERTVGQNMYVKCSNISSLTFILLADVAERVPAAVIVIPAIVIGRQRPMSEDAQGRIVAITIVGLTEAPVAPSHCVVDCPVGVIPPRDVDILIHS